ncbi:hypothetical protein LTR09_012521 [Extremus antarcticus]|uniref:Uncharacterized protein n=1 Tax=Extremus antarcticus TaxID=702011 RepID=A0AAJ0D4Z2_9PEZI|nr:hypothetical protein LTR09_012521 [Extremus antarcticus]
MTASISSNDVEEVLPGVLRLPVELRDVIYDLTLVPETPIEFAPLNCDDYSDIWSAAREHDALISVEDGRGWHIKRWQEQDQPTLLRVCRQINQEATPVFYSQPFRFSNKAGWLILYYWLSKIGAENRAHLKDITSFFALHLRPYGLGCLPDSQVGEPEAPRVMDRVPLMLTEIAGLRRLALLISPAEQNSFCDSLVGYKRLATDPINGVDWSRCRDLEVFVLNVTDCFAGNHSRTGPAVERDHICFNYLFYKGEHEVTDACVCSLFDQAGSKRMPLVRVHHDGNRLYPVAPREWCSNAEFCRCMLQARPSRLCKTHWNEAWYEELFRPRNDDSPIGEQTLQQIQEDESKADAAPYGIRELTRVTRDGRPPMGISRGAGWHYGQFGFGAEG